MLITVIIAAYKDTGMIKRAIDSIFAQEYPDFELLVCSDGEDRYVEELVESYNDRRIEYHFVEFQGKWGYRSRNEMSKIATGDIILHLDQDNIFYNNCFFRVAGEWEDELGLLVFRINHQRGVIPEGDLIKHKNIDTMNGAIKREIAKRAEFNPIVPSGDSEYYKQVESICNKECYKIKYIKDVLGIHN